VRDPGRLGGPGPARPAPGDGRVRAAQEAIVNAERHAKASTITITACLRRGALVVEVADDGAGFGLGAPAGGGLDRARQRVELAGGSLTATSRPGSGTTVTICVPINS
jgi:signal transduction histidine kinase